MKTKNQKRLRRDNQTFGFNESLIHVFGTFWLGINNINPKKKKEVHKSNAKAVKFAEDYFLSYIEPCEPGHTPEFITLFDEYLDEPNLVYILNSELNRYSLNQVLLKWFGPKFLFNTCVFARVVSDLLSQSACWACNSFEGGFCWKQKIPYGSLGKKLIEYIGFEDNEICCNAKIIDLLVMDCVDPLFNAKYDFSN